MFFIVQDISSIAESRNAWVENKVCITKSVCAISSFQTFVEASEVLEIDIRVACRTPGCHRTKEW